MHMTSRPSCLTAARAAGELPVSRQRPRRETDPPVRTRPFARPSILGGRGIESARSRSLLGRPRAQGLSAERGPTSDV